MVILKPLSCKPAGFRNPTAYIRARAGAPPTPENKGKGKGKGKDKGKDKGKGKDAKDSSKVDAIKDEKAVGDFEDGDPGDGEEADAYAFEDGDPGDAVFIKAKANATKAKANAPKKATTKPAWALEL